MRKFYFTVFCVIILNWAHAQSKMPMAATVQVEVLAKFYPNPATTQVTFEFSKLADKDLQFQVFNFIGKKMADLPVTTKLILPVNEYYRGIYIFQIRDKNGKVVQSGKFQVAR
jgi:hypothetical protein